MKTHKLVFLPTVKMRKLTPSSWALFRKEFKCKAFGGYNFGEFTFYQLICNVTNFNRRDV